MSIDQQGWIKIRRQITEWEWYDDLTTFRLFFHCIFKANWKDSKCRGLLIKEGELLTSLQILASETGLTVQQVRTSLKKLESTHEVTSERTPQGTKIQVVKYRDYQQATHEVTSDQHTINTRATHEQQLNKNIKNLKERIADFKKSLLSFRKDNQGKYSDAMYKEFFEYWSEHSETDRKFRKEKEKSFDIARRLTTWHKRSITFDNVKTKKMDNKTVRTAEDFENLVKNGL